MFISYAQNFEDVMLWRALKDIQNGFYIDIGAQDPTVDSVSRGFYEKGWRGVHVEPTPHHAGMLRKDRPDEVVIEAAVGCGTEPLHFFDFLETGLSTGDRSLAEQQRLRGFEYKERNVEQISLGSILNRAEAHVVHWLKIDVEGMEDQVLASWGDCPKRPWIIVVEATSPTNEQRNDSEWAHYLVQRGYRFAYFDGLNAFYVHQSQGERLSSFAAPPNVFDRFFFSGKSTSSFCGNLTSKISYLEIDKHTLLSKIAENDIYAGSLRLKVAELESDIAENDIYSNSLDVKVAELESDKAFLQARIDGIETAFKNEQEVRSSLEAGLQAIYGSTSWKLTAPIRRGILVIRHFRHGVKGWIFLRPNTRPRRVCSSILRLVYRYAASNAWAMRLAKRLLKINPGLERLVRRALSSAPAYDRYAPDSPKYGYSNGSKASVTSDLETLILERLNAASIARNQKDATKK
ncbi:FkbM family methyltransferase [Neorhizobium sp. JUb45]|uniref:FkbM family methyltransferase n=1 Tax=Neorhizobium sp. JUb45 TaxID=2485113 RepID=UPI001404836F|nr:FkbM family methyltransferase [Neorhizobium sp. JUb45]